MTYLFLSAMIFLFMIGQWNERRSQRGREHERAVTRSFKGREPAITDDGPESQEHREWRERYDAVWREAFRNAVPRAQKVAWWIGGIVGIPALALALAAFNERDYGPTWAQTTHTLTHGEILTAALIGIGVAMWLANKTDALSNALDLKKDDDDDD